ncbi:ImmA/IrrE family metallo-endopeptidase [Aquifex pyrophilus]
MAKLRINPEILKYELKYTKLTVEELAKKTYISENTIIRALKGEKAFSYKQLLKIANLLRRPTWYFFEDEPMQEERLKDFRRKDTTINFLMVVQIVREIKQFQELLKEVIEELNYEPKFDMFKNVDINSSPQKVADVVREVLKPPDLSSVKTYKEALQIHKSLLESYDILIFEYKLTEDKTSKSLKALSVHDNTFPAIVLNKDDSISSKIFSLYHELGHILRKSTAVCEYDEFEEDYSKEEQFCNAFAGHFLVPTQKFLTVLNNYKSIDENTIERIAFHFKVSPFVIIRRLKEEKIINKGEFTKYEDYFKNKVESTQGENKSTFSPEPYIKVFNRVSKKALRLLFDAISERILDEDTLMKILHLKKQEQMEKLEGKVYEEEMLYS